MANPVGPGGSWTLEFEDLFPGTSLDLTRWGYLNGNAINGTSCLGTASCTTVSGGYMYLTVASASQGAYISSAPSDGAGVNGWVLPTNGCVEARMYIPGPSSTQPYNWGGYFTSGQAWPTNGEIDVCETNGSGIDINYHWESGGEQQSGPYNPSGNWCNSWHTYTAERGTSTVSFYWDGALVHAPWTTDDGGGGHSILPCNGTGGGGPEALGISYAIVVDYVRGWIAGGGGGGGGGGSGTLSYVAAPATSQSSGGVSSFSVSKQAGTAAGDQILIYVFGVNATSPACTGFAVSPVDNENIGTLLQRVADGTEGSSFLITGLGGAAVTATIATVAGATSALTAGSPANAAGSYASFGNPSITLTGVGWALWFAGVETGFGGAGYAITPPSGYTSRSTNGAQSGNATMMLADNQSAGGGATGTETGTSTSPGYWSGVMVALYPAPVASPSSAGLLMAGLI
jgi:hypothetical protein